MLNQFLADVPKNNPASYDRFFADDVIYHSQYRRLTTKADIIKVSPPVRPASTHGDNYHLTAEDITIHEYPDVAIVAFRLVAS